MQLEITFIKGDGNKRPNGPVQRYLRGYGVYPSFIVPSGSVAFMFLIRPTGYGEYVPSQRKDTVDRVLILCVFLLGQIWLAGLPVLELN